MKNIIAAAALIAAMCSTTVPAGADIIVVPPPHGGGGGSGGAGGGGGLKVIGPAVVVGTAVCLFSQATACGNKCTKKQLDRNHEVALGCFVPPFGMLMMLRDMQ